MISSSIANIFIFISLYLIFPVVNATTVIYQDLQQISNSSDHIIKGNIKKIKYKEKKGNIFSIIVITDAYLINDDVDIQIGKDVKIKIKGGIIPILDEKGNKVGIKEQKMVGAPSFELGETVLIFVSGNGYSDMPIVGWSQGKFSIDEQRVLTSDGHEVTATIGNDIVEKTKSGNIKIKGKILSKSSRKKNKLAVISSDGGFDKIISKTKDYDEIIKLSSSSIADDKDFIRAVKGKLKNKIKKISLEDSYFNEELPKKDLLINTKKINKLIQKSNKATVKKTNGVNHD